MAGPMPPAIGGMSTVLADLRNSSLKDQVDLAFFDTFKSTPEGRSIFTAIKSKLKLWLKWIQLLKENVKTIVHIHTCSGFTFFLDSVLICLARLFSVPVIIHIHGARFDRFVDGLNPFLLKYVKWVFARCSKIIVLSSSWEKIFVGKLGKFPYVVVENGVPIDKTFTSDKSNKNNKVEILFLGNLTERKGVWELIDAMQFVEGAVLNFVGGEEDIGIFQQVEELVEKNNLQNKIIIHGPKYGDDKNDFLGNSDVFVLPSYAEGLPISLLEAMAKGIPVIVTPVGGIPAVVSNQQEGILVKVGDKKELADAINRLVQNPNLRHTMGMAARKRCEEQFGIEKTVQKLMNVYTEVL